MYNGLQTEYQSKWFIWLLWRSGAGRNEAGTSGIGGTRSKGRQGMLIKLNVIKYEIKYLFGKETNFVLFFYTSFLTQQQLCNFFP